MLGVAGPRGADDGTSAVVASPSPRWNGGPDVMKVGVSTFDATGNPQWTLELPGDYTGGYPSAIGSTADGDLIVAGTVDEARAVSVRGLSRDGELRFEFEVESGFPELEVRRETGRAFVGTNRGLAVIDRDGTSCREFSIAADRDAPGPAEPWRADRDYVLDHSAYLTRFRIPE